MRDIKDLIFYLSQTQEELKDHLDVLLRFKNYSPVNRDGFLYAKGDIPLLLVAHLDTEADEPPYEVKHDTELDKLYNESFLYIMTSFSESFGLVLLEICLNN